MGLADELLFTCCPGLSEWGKPAEDAEGKDDKPPALVEKPNFGLSGALAKDAKTGNMYKGVPLKVCVIQLGLRSNMYGHQSVTNQCGSATSDPERPDSVVVPHPSGLSRPMLSSRSRAGDSMSSRRESTSVSPAVEQLVA